ncbi:hypothetical protein [Streptomyces violascens]|uniref:hypothetical protein n=1 Tax=Streptomyces violascens TaxID=67381 RepID=UPI0036AA1A36
MAAQSVRYLGVDRGLPVGFAARAQAPSGVLDRGAQTGGDPVAGEAEASGDLAQLDGSAASADAAGRLMAAACGPGIVRSGSDLVASAASGHLADSDAAGSQARAEAAAKVWEPEGHALAAARTAAAMPGGSHRGDRAVRTSG